MDQFNYQKEKSSIDSHPKKEPDVPIKPKHLIWIFLASPFIIIALFALEHHILPLFINFGYPKDITEFHGQFILASALFTGMAFIGLIFTILLQQTECRQLASQQDMLNRQMFQNSFYNQLHHVHELINNTRVTFFRQNEPSESKAGHDAMDHLFDFIQGIGAKMQEGRQLSQEEETTIREADTSISPFLRSFFSFADMTIQNSDLTEEDKKQYVCLLSNGLTFKEAYLLGIYGRTYRFNCNEKKITDVLNYMHRHNLWQKDVIQDVFGSPHLFPRFDSIVNRDNKDRPEE